MAAVSMRVAPPPRALAMAAVVAGVLGAVAVATGTMLGVHAGVGAALGGLAVAALALVRGARRAAVGLGLTLAVLAAVATQVAGDAVLTGVVVALAALVTLPWVIRYGPVCGTAPVVVAAMSLDAAQVGPWAALGGVAVAGAAVPWVTHAIGLSRLEPRPMRRGTATLHVTALALGAGGALAVAVANHVAHAPWLVIALSAVLVPARGETTSRASGRVAGTMVGTLAAAMVAGVLPGWLCGLLAAVAAVLGIAWTVAADRVRSPAFTAASVVLVIGAASADLAWSAAGQRILLTAAGVALAVVLAAGLAWIDRRREAR